MRTEALQIPSTGYGTHGLIRVSTVADVANAQKAAAEATQNKQVIMDLAAYLRRLWTAARDNKHSKVQYELLDNLRRCNGEYHPSKLAKIREQGGAEVFMQLTQAKKRACKAWVKDILLNSGEKPWTMDLTKVPDPPPHIEPMVKQAILQMAMQAQAAGQPIDMNVVMQTIEQGMEEIQKRVKEIVQEVAKKMEDKIEDQFQEGGWEQAFDDFLDNLFTYKTAFFKGPIVRRRKKLQWGQVPGQDPWVPVTEKKLVPEWYAPSPLDIYPAPDSKRPGDSYHWEHHRLQPADLAGMRGQPGYDTASIDAVLDIHGASGLRNWMSLDGERSLLEGRWGEQSYNATTIDALQFYGTVPGKLLLEWGMSPSQVPDQFDFYQIEAWIIDRFVIRAQINPDPLDRIPMWSASFEAIPGAFWGRALPEILADIQDICNAVARAIINNVGFASGPMLGVNRDRIAEGEDATSIYPWRIWEFLNHQSGISEPPITFFQPDLHTDQLIRVFDYFSKLADEYLGVPSYAHGDNPTGGAGNTASGLSMLLGAASKIIKQVIANCDDVISPSVEFQYTHNMIYDPDHSIKADLAVVANGAMKLFVKEQQQMRRNEFLTATNNPTDMAIIGLPGRAELLRGACAALDLDVEKIVPDDDEIDDKVMNNLMMMSRQKPQESGKPTELDPAGNPVAGQDYALFQNQPAGGM